MSNDSGWYRINEVEQRSGVSRRTVHFYLERGLLHPPRRTGRTMAYYDDIHLAELKYIRAARAQGTPLFAIKEQLATRFRQNAASPARPSILPDGRKREGAGAARRGRPSGRQEMRARILDVACRLFLRKGFRATAVSDITARLEVGKGTFYFYFSDKDELFLECAPRIFQALFSEKWEALRRERDPVRRLALRAEAVLPVLDKFCAILALAREALNSPEPRIRDMGRQTIASIGQPLEDDLSKGMARGLIRPLDPKATSMMLVGIMESLQYLQAVGVKLSAAQLREAVSKLLLSGIQST